MRVYFEKFIPNSNSNKMFNTIVILICISSSINYFIIKIKYLYLRDFGKACDEKKSQKKTDIPENN